MSAVNSANPFTPNTVVVEPPNRPDQLAEAVLSSLNRGRWGYKGRPWGVIKTAVVSAFTLGLGPLAIWPCRMRRFMSSEQQQLWQLAEWLRLRTGKQEAVALRDEAARELGPSAGLRPANLFIIVIAVLMFVRLAQTPFFHLNFVFNAAWAPHHDGYRLYARFFSFWTVLLVAGYLLYWLEICIHSAALERYVAEFNAITAAEGIEPVRVASVGSGLHFVWIIFGLIGLANGAVWAIPLALAGAVQTRYVWVTSRETRADLARRVRTMLDNTRPALDVRTTPRASARPCPNEKCHAPVRPGSTFCPRCGTRIA